MQQNNINKSDEKGLKQGLWIVKSELGQYWTQSYINDIPFGYYEYKFYSNEFKQCGYYAR